MSGDCCRLFYINLNEEEYRSQRYQTQFEEAGFIDDFTVASEAGAAILAKNDDGSCVYLKDNKCSIHPERPQVCRPFTCSSTAPEFAGMVDTVKRFRKEMRKP